VLEADEVSDLHRLRHRREPEVVERLVSDADGDAEFHA
jgi:hypothetical protein